MMILLANLASRFNARIQLDENLVVKKRNRYFLLGKRMKPIVQRNFFYAGVYLGKVRRRIFFPSFIMLAMIAEGKANKIKVNYKTAWLFACGRDVFRKGILDVSGSIKKGRYALILDQRGECLGFGKISRNIDEDTDQNEVIVKNISDIGDFLRRESHLTKLKKHEP